MIAWIYAKSYSLFLKYRSSSFLIFSLIYFFIVWLLIYKAYTTNYFTRVDMSDFFITCWWTLWAIFALCLTIHFFYAQSSTVYNSLAFIFDTNRSKINYEIFTILWFITFFFFYLWGNYNSLIFKCPDTWLFPFSLILLAFSLWLVIYHFNYVAEKLSPVWISKSINDYFKNNLNKLKKYEKIKKRYLQIVWVKEKEVWMIDFMDPLWYKLEALCDNYLKLVNISEYRLANDLISNIQHCFLLLFKSYNPIYSYTEPSYFTTKTIIDNKIENFFKKIIWIIESCIKHNNIQWITETINLYSNLIISLSEAKYEYIVWSTIIWSENFLFYNWLYFRTDLYVIIEKYDNVEAFFQWKEWLNKILRELLNNPDKYRDSAERLWNLLSDINKLNLWSISHNKNIFELHEIYGLCYTSLLNKNSIFNENNLNNDLWFYAKLFLIHKNSINPFFNLIFKFVSLNSDIIVAMVQNDNGFIDNYQMFIDEIYKLIVCINQLEKIDFDSDLWLLIHELVRILYLITENTDISIDRWLYKILGILSIILENNNNIFPDNYLFNTKIYDSLCRIWIKAIQDSDNELFERCFSIFVENIKKLSITKWFSSLSCIKYFCFRFFIDSEENHWKYLDILREFFDKQKTLYNNDSYWKNTMIHIIDEIEWCYEETPQTLSPELSYFVLRDYEWIRYEHQEEIKNKVYEYCENIYD